jgi:hypothetical protein
MLLFLREAFNSNFTQREERERIRLFNEMMARLGLKQQLKSTKGATADIGRNGDLMLKGLRGPQMKVILDKIQFRDLALFIADQNRANKILFLWKTFENLDSLLRAKEPCIEDISFGIREFFRLFFKQTPSQPTRVRNLRDALRAATESQEDSSGLYSKSFLTPYLHFLRSHAIVVIVRFGSLHTNTTDHIS